MGAGGPFVGTQEHLERVYGTESLLSLALFLGPEEKRVVRANALAEFLAQARAGGADTWFGCSGWGKASSDFLNADERFEVLRGFNAREFFPTFEALGQLLGARLGHGAVGETTGSAAQRIIHFLQPMLSAVLFCALGFCG